MKKNELTAWRKTKENIMTHKILSSQFDNTDKRVFISIENTKAHAIVDKWNDDNQISNWTVKCKTWNWLCRKLNTILEDQIKEFLNLDGLTVKYSRTAGCWCGCSPGFLVKDGTKNVHIIQVDGKSVNNIWLELDVDDCNDYIIQQTVLADERLKQEKAKLTDS